MHRSLTQNVFPLCKHIADNFSTHFLLLALIILWIWNIISTYIHHNIGAYKFDINENIWWLCRSSCMYIYVCAIHKEQLVSYTQNTE